MIDIYTEKGHTEGKFHGTPPEQVADVCTIIRSVYSTLKNSFEKDANFFREAPIANVISERLWDVQGAISGTQCMVVSDGHSEDI